MKFIPRSGVIIIYTAAYQFNIGRTRLRRQMPIRRAQSGFLPASAAQPIKSTIRHIRQTRISARTANAACTRERNGKNHEDTYRGGTFRSTIHKLSMRSGAVYYDLDRTAAAREVHIGTQRARRKPGARPIGTRAIRCRSERCSARHNGCCRRDARKQPRTCRRSRQFPIGCRYRNQLCAGEHKRSCNRSECFLRIIRYSSSRCERRIRYDRRICGGYRILRLYRRQRDICI